MLACDKVREENISKKIYVSRNRGNLIELDSLKCIENCLKCTLFSLRYLSYAIQFQSCNLNVTFDFEFNGQRSSTLTLLRYLFSEL